jgi:hypothetical protein
MPQRRSAYEDAWQAWKNGGGAERGEPMPRAREFAGGEPQPFHPGVSEQQGIWQGPTRPPSPVPPGGRSPFEQYDPRTLPPQPTGGHAGGEPALLPSHPGGSEQQEFWQDPGWMAPDVGMANAERAAARGHKWDGMVGAARAAALGSGGVWDGMVGAGRAAAHGMVGAERAPYEQRRRRPQDGRLSLGALNRSRYRE